MLQIINYSEKAVAVIGDTKEIKEQLIEKVLKDAEAGTTPETAKKTASDIRKISLPEPTDNVLVRNVPLRKSEIDRYVNRMFLIRSNNSLTCFDKYVGRFYQCFDTAICHVISDKPAMLSPQLSLVDGTLLLRIVFDGYCNDFYMHMLSKECERHVDYILENEFVIDDKPEWFEKIEIKQFAGCRKIGEAKKIKGFHLP